MRTWKLPPHSMTAIYEDDRFKDRFAITMRGVNLVETWRYHRREEAQKAQRAFKKAGLKVVKR